MSDKLISDEVESALVEQLSAEKYNASVYLYIAAYLNGKGLSNLAKFFESQHDEEQKHSLIIYKLLTDLNITFPIREIPQCDMPINSMMDIAELFLSREVTTTVSLKAIKNMAAENDEGACSVVETAMIEMIKMQQSELEEATTFKDKVELLENNWAYAMLWDASLG